MMQNQPVLELREISKDYPGVQALDRVSISFRKGEIHGLVGENGAGKSTLIKILAGVVKAEQGKIVIHKKQKKISSARDARRLGLSCIQMQIVLQHPYHLVMVLLEIALF